MPRHREELLDALADTALALFDKDNNDPSAEEIAKAYYAGKIVGKETVQGVAGRLHKIRDILQDEHDLTIQLVSEVYYGEYRRRLPKDSDGARKCLPRGRGIKPKGIRNVINMNDPIYREYLIWTGSLATGHTTAVLRRIRTEIEAGRLTDQQAHKIVKGRIRAVPLKERTLYQKVLERLPAPE